MFEWKINEHRFYIREVRGEAEFHAIEDLQKEAWSFSDLDIVPAATLIATQHAGGILLGAFEDGLMIGFAYAFPAFEEGRTSMHSHMLAVKPEYRNFQAGFYLKLAQRERTIESGLDEITWTFDPLQSLNAHLNFTKLGVISNRYIVNFYGEETSSPLHQGFGTDRLWVRWLLNSDRVKQRISEQRSVHSIDSAARRRSVLSGPSARLEDASILEAALVYSEDARPRLAEFESRLSSATSTIEIPHNINALKEREPKLGTEWREATRAAFLAAMNAGLVVEDLLRVECDPFPRWFYLLRR
ncbi:MAG TPA: hypothetical protein VLM38_09050 [Blastocatellia bacterium]|nr:hypothetical protein [Blastocatellia bacterium]